MRRSGLAVAPAMSICTQFTVPLNELAWGVVVADRGAGVLAEVGGLLGGEDHRYRRLHPPGC